MTAGERLDVVEGGGAEHSRERAQEASRRRLDDPPVEPKHARARRRESRLGCGEERALPDPADAVHERDDRALRRDLALEQRELSLSADERRRGRASQAVLEPSARALISFSSTSRVRLMREIPSNAILARVSNRRIVMNHCCVQVELKLNVSGAEWRAACQGAVPIMLAVPGLKWKVWVLDDEAESGGGFYLFRDRASAEAYVEGPVIARLRSSSAVREFKVRLLPVIDELSRQTHALGVDEEEASLGLVG